MSRVRWAVHFADGYIGSTRFEDRRETKRSARDVGGKVVRITSYSAAETAARRAVIESAREVVRCRCDYQRNRAAVDTLASALEALERKEAKK